MNLEEWKITKGSHGGPNLLYHRMDDHWGDGVERYTLNLRISRIPDDGNWAIAIKKPSKWACVGCDAEAPEEIQYAALLCRCYG